MRRIGILLAGCGHLDGSDPVQAVSAALAVDAAGDLPLPLAPDVEQRDSLDPLTGRPLGFARRVLPEAARLWRGGVRRLEDVHPDEVDALLVPGGLGVVKTLAPLAEEGESAAPLPVVQELLDALRRGGRPVGAVGEGVVLVAAAWRGEGLALAAGDDPLRAEILRRLGHAPAAGAGPLAVEAVHLVTAMPAGGEDRKGAAAAVQAVVSQMRSWMS